MWSDKHSEHSSKIFGPEKVTKCYECCSGCCYQISENSLRFCQYITNQTLTVTIVAIHLQSWILISSSLITKTETHLFAIARWRHYC